eukprot:142138_1
MSQTQAHKQKEAIGRRQFNITSSEKLIDQLNCKYKSKLSATGALWVFQGHFCYYSNLFGQETKIRLRISEISKATPSGNHSIEIVTKTNELYKLVAFPSKEKRDSVIQFISESKTNHSQSPHSKPHTKPIKRLQSHSVDGSIPSHHAAKPDASTLHKTSTIHHRHTSKSKLVPPTLPAPSKPNKMASNSPNEKQNHIDLKAASDMATRSEEQVHPSRLLTRESYVAKSQSITHHKHNNTPNFRLQAIHSQQSLRLTTPSTISDSDRESPSHPSPLLRKKSDKDPGSSMDTMDIRNYTMSNEDGPITGRPRSWSDSEVPHCEDPKVIQYDTNKRKKKSKHSFGSAAWFDNIFNPRQSHSKGDKRKKPSDKASASLSSLGALKKTPPIVRAKTHLTPTLPVLHSNSEIVQSRSVPDEIPVQEKKSESCPLPASLVQYIDESHSKTTMHLGGFDTLEFDPLYSDVLSTTPALLFDAAWSDSFVQKMHHDRGSTELIIGKWTLDEDEETPDNQPKTLMRKVEYISKIKDPPPFIAPQTEVYETQRFRFYGSNMVVVDVAIRTPNVKFGDYFVIVNRYILHAMQQDVKQTHLEVSIAIQWIKKTWFEKIIASKATSEAGEGMVLWGSKLRALFPPTPGKEENKEIMEAPRRRVIDKKVIDYFHTPRQRRKNAIVNEWVKPCVRIIMDIVRCAMDPSTWRQMAQENELNMKHAIMVISVLVLLIVLFNIGWMLLWMWYSSSLNHVIAEQNKILQKQSQILEELLTLLKPNDE